MIEFLKVILSIQVIAGALCLFFFFKFEKEIKKYIDRIAKVTAPGGTEVSTPQPTKADKESADKSVPLNPAEEEKIPTTLENNELEQVKILISDERARARVWEYNYLNYFLVHNSQLVLNWFSSCDTPVSEQLFHSFWAPAILDLPERKTIVSVLESHYLIIIESGLITISPKGAEYIVFRGDIT